MKSSRARCRSRFLTMAKSKQAAIGFRVHSGWAAAVAVCVDKGAPVVLARQRVHLVETFTYGFRQPYHTAEKFLFGQARGFFGGLKLRRSGQVYGAVGGLDFKTQKKGGNLIQAGCRLFLAGPL